MGLTLILGGARAGKSALAQRLGEAWTGPVTVVATARAGEAGMAARIARHRADRPADWRTIEEPIDLAAAMARASHDAVLIIDCLTVWVANLMGAGWTPEAVIDAAAALAGTAAARLAPTVAVSNEVGMGVHPLTALGRDYQDLLGRVNTLWARAADTALLLVAGRALPLVAPETILPALRERSAP